jgi:hypothetical protein
LTPTGNALHKYSVMTLTRSKRGKLAGVYWLKISNRRNPSGEGIAYLVYLTAIAAKKSETIRIFLLPILFLFCLQ